MSKAEVLAITGVTFPTIWSWMRNGTFPRSRVVGGKSMWFSSEIEAWLAALPVRQLKGDEPKAHDTWDHEKFRNEATLRAKRDRDQPDEPNEVIPTNS
jgi:predicted DNA-binding transcriptional regulator AlpA